MRVFPGIIGAHRAAIRSLMTRRSRVSRVEKFGRGTLLVPVFGSMLILLRLRAMMSGPLRVETTTDDGDRFICHLPDLIQMYLYLFGVWEPDLAAYIRSRLQDGDVFVDVGANIGYDTLLAARRVGAAGRVIAIEASPPVFARLSETLRINGSPGTVRVINQAAADRAGTLTIYSGPQHNVGLTTTVRRGAMPPVGEVLARPLGDLLQDDEKSRVRLIKIDVEGGEDAVLAGMLAREAGKGAGIDRLPRDVEIAVELSPLWWRDRNKTATTALQPFIDCGFHVYTIPNNYWPWRYLWPNDVQRPRRLRDASLLTTPMKRLDVILSRVGAEAL
jgi:FkbM family methyltransferase